MKAIFRSRIFRGVAVLLAAFTVGWSGAFAARLAPGAGRFLIAKGGQPGVFSRSVVLLIAYGPNGAVGLIVNRPTEFPLAKAIPDVSDLQGSDHSLYFGGPVSLDHLTLLIRSKMPPPDVTHVVDDVYASGSIRTLRAIVSGKLAGAHFRGYAGYAGWAPGQLDAEIARGGWLVLQADSDDVFTTDPIGLWHKLIQRQNTILVDVDRGKKPLSLGRGIGRRAGVDWYGDEPI